MKRKHVFWMVAGMLALWLLHGVLTVMGGEAGYPALTVRREGEDLWSLSLSADPLALTSGDPMALLLALQAPEGWRVCEITAGHAAEGLILTHGDLPAEEVKVLLDGYATASDEGEILWVRMEKATQEPRKQGGYMGVTGGDGEALTLFVLRGSGEVEVIPMTVEVEPGGWHESMTDGEASGNQTENQTENQPGESPEKPTETNTDTYETAEGTQDSAPPTDGDGGNDPLPDRFLGCRETGVRDGTFTVQFLFRGEYSVTPVICMEGGGVLWVESGAMRPLTLSEYGDVWHYCAFRGLSDQRRYVFWVGTEEGWIRAVYEKGVFQKFG